jgi:hypothetical protein
MNITHDITPESICNAWCITNEFDVEIHHKVAPLLYPAITTILKDFSDETIRKPLITQAEETYKRLMIQYKSLDNIKNHFITEEVLNKFTYLIE